MKKKLVALLMCVSVLGALVFTGCGSNSSPETANSDPKSENAETEAETDESESTDQEEEGADGQNQTEGYYGNDISETKELVMYVIGDEPAAAEEVEKALNEKLLEKVNATVDINYISLSDYEQKYSLLLASGENIDLIYTSTWAFYTEEATKGAFMEVTDELLEQYMPQTYAQEDAMAFEQAKIDGKCYFIPKNSPNVNNAMPILIRGDLREKYGMDTIDSVEKLEAYFDAVIENEEGIYPYAAGGDGVELSMKLFQARNNMVPLTSIAGGKYFGYIYQGNNPTWEDFVWQYGSDEYKNYCELVKTWADKGFWSKNAVSNTTSPLDAFENGTSAALFWNLDTCESAKAVVDSTNPEWKAELIDICPDASHFAGDYTGDGIAICAVSENQERAMMVLDVLKCDKECYDIARYGIEGDTYIETSDTNYLLGDGQANYQVANAPISWGLKNQNLERIQGEAGTEMSEMRKALTEDAISETSSGFIFDDTNVKSELAAISEVCSQYIPLLELGLVDNVESALTDLNTKCETAGLEKVTEEFKTQWAAYEEGLK